MFLYHSSFDDIMGITPYRVFVYQNHNLDAVPINPNDKLNVLNDRYSKLHHVGSCTFNYCSKSGQYLELSQTASYYNISSMPIIDLNQSKYEKIDCCLPHIPC